jgi:hypothetical protein
MIDMTFEDIHEAYKKVLSLSPQLQFRADREAARQDDIKNNRGFLVINPELDLGGMDVHGCVVEKDGIEYRVLIDERLRGMRVKDEDGNDTKEIRHGWWVAPPSDLTELLGPFQVVSGGSQ